jgi:predicted nucleic acid-binding protein
VERARCALSSRLASPEVCAALTAAERNNDLTESEARVAASDWEQFWASVRPVEWSTDVERAAGSLATTHQLRGADAVHLAGALALGSTDLIVAVWDRRLLGSTRTMASASQPLRSRGQAADLQV